MVLIVTYDLHNAGRDYDSIAKTLKSATGGWAHPQGSVWLIDSPDSASDWVDKLRAAGDDNDEYFVSPLKREAWASYNTDKDVVAWLKSSSRNW